MQFKRNAENRMYYLCMNNAGNNIRRSAFNYNDWYTKIWIGFAVTR